MKASDNPFPSILVDEEAAPAAPAAGQQRLFVDPADHLLKMIDSAGTVTPIGSGGGGGGSAVGVGDFALWKRTGVQDPTSGTFDFTADLVDSLGSSISVDSSSAWTTIWTSPAPVLVEGVYSFTLSQTKSAAFWTDLQLLDAAGVGVTWTPSAYSTGDILYMIAQDNGVGSFVAHASITLHVPAGTHVDLGRGIGTDTTAQSNLLIQKVG